jgi:hypothetical protein
MPKGRHACMHWCVCTHPCRLRQSHTSSSMHRHRGNVVRADARSGMETMPQNSVKHSS